MLFDGKRMFWGGFKTVIELWTGALQLGVVRRRQSAGSAIGSQALKRLD